MRKQRVISAIVLIALAAAATALGSYVLGALILVFICMGIYEIYKAFENKGFRPVYAIGFCFAVLFLLQTVFQTPEMMNLYIGDTFLGGENGVLKGCAKLLSVNWAVIYSVLLLIVLLTVMVFKHDKYTPADAAITVFGAAYVTVLTSYSMSLRGLDGGKGGLFLFLLALLTDIAADTAAYEVGSRWGKHKLIPAVSPKKTVEGSIGAFGGVILAALIMGLLFTLTGWFTGLKLYWYPVIGLMVGFLAQVGDLAASMVKRYAGIKDFSNLIPGHGGVLDRLDSLMFVFPAVYYLVRLVM